MAGFLYKLGCGLTVSDLTVPVWAAKAVCNVIG